METVEDSVRTGKALPGPTRVRILSCPAIRQLRVCEMVRSMGSGQPSVSRHLGILKDAGLVEDARDGTYVNHRRRRPARRTSAESARAGLPGSHCRDPGLRDLPARAKTVSHGTG